MDGSSLISLIITDYTLRTVSLGAAILGLVSGVLGSYAVLRKQSLLGDAMSHATLPGVVLAFLITGSKSLPALMMGAMVAGWLGALVVILVTSQTRIKQDAGLGIVLAVFFGMGTAMLSWVQRHSASVNQSGLDKFLFGRAAALIQRDVLMMAGLGIVALLCVMLFWKEFKLLSFNPEFAASLGLPVRGLDIFLTTLIVVAIVVGLQTVGVVLMSAMIIAPAAAARQWTDRLGVMVMLAGIFGALAGVTGALISSLGSGLSTGPVIVLSASVWVFISMLVAPNRGLLARMLRERRNRKRLRRAAVLETLYRMGLQHEDPRRPHSYHNLDAAMPGRGVGYTLNILQREGLVLEMSPGYWALTDMGIESIERLMLDTRAQTFSGQSEEHR